MKTFLPTVIRIVTLLFGTMCSGTRAPQAMASYIKFRNRSRWLYTYNIYLMPEFELKLWERFPGTVAVSKSVLHSMTDFSGNAGRTPPSRRRELNRHGAA